MYDLTVIKKNGNCYIDSREVAYAIGKSHKNLLRDIARYISQMNNSNQLKIEPVKFFVESSYLDAKGELRPCYLISKMGCELVGNKLAGEKGILFTAAYVTLFNKMEAKEHLAMKCTESETRALQIPRLGEYNACARIIVRGLKDLGATTAQILSFLKGVYEPLGISVAFDNQENTPQMYTAKQIAKMYGVYSISGKLHSQAVTCIINENMLLGDKHKMVTSTDYANHRGISILYDEYAANAVKDWLMENDYPNEIYGFDRTYYVLYDYQV